MSYWGVNFVNREDKDLWFRFGYHKTVEELFLRDGRIQHVVREAGKHIVKYFENLGDERFYKKCKPIVWGDGEWSLPFNQFYHRVGLLCSGMTVDAAFDYIKAHTDLFQRKEKGAEPMALGFIVNVKRPEVRRDIDNKNRDTFDFVRVEMVLRVMDEEERKNVLTEKRGEIIEYALKCIGQDAWYSRYGVSTDYLKPYSIGVHGSILIIDFELKKAEKGGVA